MDNDRVCFEIFHEWNGVYIGEAAREGLRGGVMTSSSLNSGPMTPPDSTAVPQWKRRLDVALVLLLLPFLLPLMIFIGLLIRLVSKGPILFKQERIGHRGEKFMCLKFRTMFVGSETASHQGYLHHLMKSDKPMIKLDTQGDSRIIPFGVLLRSSGLDELPQLVNVLRGDMSLVGPRPCLAYEYENYLPWQRERFNTLPGLTGLWQVSGKNSTTFAEMMHLDITYAREKSLWLDLWIILKTAPAILDQVRGARKTKSAKPLPLPQRSSRPLESNV